MKTLNLDSNLIDSKDKKKKKSDPANQPKNNHAAQNTSQKNKSKEKLKKSESKAANKKDRQNNKSSNKKPKKKNTNFIKNLLKKYKELKPTPKIILTIVVCALIAGIGGGITYWFIIQTKEPAVINFPEHVTAKSPGNSKFTLPKLPKPEPPRDQPNPINGELYTIREIEEIKKRYPIAVMIENHIDARNQSGYNSADLVFETLVEGGITRTMAIFWGQECDEIGPIRSARKYYIDWLMPYDPLFMHIGYAISDDPQVDVASNLYNQGIKSLDKGGTFWRSSKKYAPHNAYTSSELIYEKAKVYGYTGNPAEIKPWQFKKDAQVDQRGNKDSVEITFFERLHNGGIYDITWKYDKQRNVYLRHQGNDLTPYMDANTDQQVYAKNVIILRSEITSTYDYKAHMIVETVGEGEAKILMDGHAINATWKKKDLESRIRFYNEEGKEIELNRGNTWISAVPIDQGSVKI